MFLGTPSYVVKTNGPFLEFLLLLFGFTLFCFYFRLLAFCLFTYNNLIHFIPGGVGLLSIPLSLLGWSDARPLRHVFFGLSLSPTVLEDFTLGIAW